MASTAYSALADQLFLEPSLMAAEVEGRLGFKFSAATIGNTSLTTTDPQLVKLGASYVSGRLQGMHLYLATAAEERIVTTMSVSGSTATINFVGGGNATNQAGATSAYLLRAPWSELRSLANDALEFIPCECLFPLAHGPDDWHMQENNTTSWTASNATLSKQTTATQVLQGARSLSISLTAASGYAESTAVKVGFSKQVIAHFLGKFDTGTGGEVQILDASNNEEGSVEFTQEDWLYARKTITSGSADRSVKFRLAGTANSDQIDVQAAWFVKPDSNAFLLPSAIDARFKVKEVVCFDFANGTSESDTWLAESYYDHRLIKDEDYELRFRGNDANPSLIVIRNQSYMTKPLFVVAEIPYSAPYGVAATFSTDASVTTCDAHLLIPYWKKLIGGSYPKNFPDAEARGEREFAERLRVRQDRGTKPWPWVGVTGRRQL